LSTPIKDQNISNCYVYPNPVKDNIYFRSSTSSIHEGNIQIFDIQGSLMVNLNTYEGQNFIAIPVSNFPSGNYTLRYISKEGIQSLPFIK
jgi:hypothetical protein